MESPPIFCEVCKQYVPPEDLKSTRYESVSMEREEAIRTLRERTRVRILHSHTKCEVPHEIPPICK